MPAPAPAPLLSPSATPAPSPSPLEVNAILNSGWWNVWPSDSHDICSLEEEMKGSGRSVRGIELKTQTIHTVALTGNTRKTNQGVAEEEKGD
ncbi:hypothetical protein E2542_SST08087 [Spatholobus suberectus]|nr:hypothetical protein E2542_SST08087 [Spatholobus suberectus]